MIVDKVLQLKATTYLFYIKMSAKFMNTVQDRNKNI